MTTRQRQPRVECPAFLAFLRCQSCCVCRAPPPVQAAHLRMGCLERDKRPTGAGEKPSDRWATPLCYLCHLDGPYAQHRMGEARFWALAGIDPFDLAEKFWAAFLLIRRHAEERDVRIRQKIKVPKRRPTSVSRASARPPKRKWPSAPLRSEARWPKGRKIRNDR